MEQIEKLLVACTPATIALIKEQIDAYRLDVENGLIEEGSKRDQELAWCDRVRETCDQIVKDKVE